MTKTRKQKQNEIYTVVIEYPKDCKIATHGEAFSAWKGKVLKNKEVVFSCDIELRFTLYKKKAFSETFEAFMRFKNGEKLVYIDNVMYDETQDK